jgi:hypothetical protein
LQVQQGRLDLAQRGCHCHQHLLRRRDDELAAPPLVRPRHRRGDRRLLFNILRVSRRPHGHIHGQHQPAAVRPGQEVHHGPHRFATVGQPHQLLEVSRGLVQVTRPGLRASLFNLFPENA